MFDYVIARATANPHIQQHCAFCAHEPLTVLLQADDHTQTLTIDAEGARLSEPSGLADLTLKATQDAWAELRRKNCRPGFQTLSAMRRAQNLIVTGNMVKFQQHMLLLEMLFANLSDDLAPETSTNTSTDDEPQLEPITGRYIRMNIEGRPHRVYFEEAGPADGIPLLCLHTAGSDGRQFRHQLNDPEITKRFRVIAFDLPWHGKSSPPAGFEREVYALTAERYMTVILAVSKALKLDRPVAMGCSIGGRVVLHLALNHADKFRALIGLQSALYVEDRSLGDPLPFSSLHRPDVHGQKHAGAAMAGLCAPSAPSTERWETLWHYMQGGPGIFMGDLNYYYVDGDLRGTSAETTKTKSACPVYLLLGEYDVSAPPEMGREAAEFIGAEHFEVMEDMGHFPMSENPDRFRQYLLPVLEKIRTQSFK